MDPKLLLLFLFSLPIACSSGQFTAVPAATPVTVNPTPASTPVTVTPGANNPGGGQPVSNPVTSPSPPVTIPPVAPTGATGGANAPSGRKWCVAKSGAQQAKVQVALDYACGMGKADCSAIQQGGSCYNPNTLQNHASYAFNSYFQKNPVQTSCDFGGVAGITTANPSTGSCVFTTSSLSSSPPSSASPAIGSPSTMTPTPVTTPTATTPSTGSAITPSGSGTVNSPGTSTGLGGIFPTSIGESPANTTTDSSTAATSGQVPRPLIGCIIVGATIVAGRMIHLDV